MPEPNDPEVVEAVAAAVVPSIKSVTARADVPGGIPDAAGITVTILSGTTQLASQPYTDLKGAHPRVDLPAEEGRIRTVDLTIKVSNGRHTVTIPWTAQVRPLYRIVVSDLRLKRTATPRCDPDGSMQVVARWVGPDGTPHEASGTSPDRVYHFPEFVTTLTDVDVTGAFSMDWYEQDPGEPVPPQNFVTAPLAFAASPTLVGHGQLKEGGGDCAGRLSYSYTWTLRTF
ncbi:hypothetical protein [Pseudonocardia sp. TRM90224]|uniref:hypothetical protein n=1 Tax=Pseudonocardia sp. TRM90224 TaxID=2812678 RepID=UPI001E5FF6F2|nr:hypothetical protein [Pseudonocardia sp. TRM90224]